MLCFFRLPMLVTLYLSANIHNTCKTHTSIILSYDFCSNVKEICRKSMREMKIFAMKKESSIREIYKYKIFTKILLLHNLYGTRMSYILLYHIILICEPSLTLVSGITKLQCVVIYLFILLLISFRAILVEATMKWRSQHENHQEIYSTIFKHILYSEYVTYISYNCGILQNSFKHHQECK